MTDNPNGEDVFDDNQDTDNKDFLSEFVGEGKKYANESELAKAMHHAQQHISSLEREQEELRGELTKKLGFEEILTEIRNASKEPSVPSEPTGGNQQTTPDTPEQEPTQKHDLEELVRQTLDQDTTRRTAQQNKTKASEMLTEAWGDEAQVKLRQRASELNLGMEELQSLAERSPDAFIQLVGVQKQEKTPVSTPSSTVNLTDLDKHQGPRRYSYWNKLKKADPQKYFSPKVQLQINNDMMEQGEDFFDD